MEAITKNFTEAEYKTYAAAVLEGIRITNTTIAKIAETAVKMNGKIYNKQFVTACNEACAGLGVNIYRPVYGGPDLKIVLINARQLNREICCSLHYNVAPEPVGADGRINAEGFAIVCARVIRGNEIHAAKVRDAAENWGESVRALKELGEIAQRMAEKINPLFVDYEDPFWVFNNIYEPANGRFTK